MDPLPMPGRDLGVNPDDMVESPEVEQEAKQEILENKDVSLHAWLKPKEPQGDARSHWGTHGGHAGCRNV